MSTAYVGISTRLTIIITTKSAECQNKVKTGILTRLSAALSYAERLSVSCTLAKGFPSVFLNEATIAAESPVTSDTMPLPQISIEETESENATAAESLKPPASPDISAPSVTGSPAMLRSMRPSGVRTDESVMKAMAAA